MPQKKPKQSAVTDRRHGTGLIAPGKQVTKQRSIQHLHGHTNGKPTTPTSSPQLPQHAHFSTTPPVSAHDYDADRFNEDMQLSFRSNGAREGLPMHAHTLSNGTSDKGLAIVEAAEDYTNGENGTNDHAVSVPQDAVKTIVGSYSRWDVLALLLLLLQLPMATQLVVELGFVFLIFGNDTNSWLSKSLSFPDNWLRLHGGNPSVGTSLLSDIIAFCFWLLLPQLFQDLVLDMALAVIAICLGGGAATRDSWKHAVMCSVTVLLGYAIRSQDRHYYLMQRLQPLVENMTKTQKLLLQITLFGGHPHPLFNRTWIQALRDGFAIVPTWALKGLRTILGIHITTYGNIRAVRRWVETINERAGTKTEPRVDLELAPAHSSVSTLTISQDSNGEGARNVSTDGRPPGLPPAARDKIATSGRRRRKQATFVRTQQPFWAAIAQVKLTFDKELELSQADHGGFGMGGSRQHHHNGESNHKLGDDKACITNVEDTEVAFAAVLPAVEEVENEADPAADRPRRGSLGSKYLDVRINGAYWSSVDCHDEAPNEDHPDECFVQGKIFGLTPLASYYIEIVNSFSHVVVFSTTTSTRPVVSSERGPAVPAPTQEALRPLSPTTTLKTSIASMESKLLDSKTKSNKVRKTHQTTARTIKQEVADLQKSSQSCGTDDKQRQRQRQLKQNIEKAEETTQDLATQLANLGEIPKADRQKYEAERKMYKTSSEQHQDLKKSLESAKRDAQKAVNDAQADNTKLHGKREKAENRLASLNDRRKTTADENNAKRNARAFNETQHARHIDHYRSQERELSARVHGTVAQREEFGARIASMHQQYYYDGNYAQSFSTHQSGNAHTPEGTYGNTAPPVSRPPPGLGWPQPIGTPANAPPMYARQDSDRTRHERVSSILSDVSGFTNDATGAGSSYNNNNAYTQPYGMPPRNTSAGGNSGGSGSQRDPSSPLPKLSPIGTEVGRGSPRPLRR